MFSTIIIRSSKFCLNLWSKKHFYTISVMFLLQFFKNTIIPIKIILLMSTCVITVVKYNFYHVYNIKFSIKILASRCSWMCIRHCILIAFLSLVKTNPLVKSLGWDLKPWPFQHSKASHSYTTNWKERIL